MESTAAYSLMGVALALGIGGGWLLRGTRGGPEADARVAGLEREVADLRGQLAEAERREPTLEATAPAPAPAAAPAPATAPTRPTPEPTAREGTAAMAADAAAGVAGEGPRWSPAGMEAALKVVDWKVVGKNLAEMAPLITKFAQDFATTGKYDAETIGRVQQLNGPLVTAALKAAEKTGSKNPNSAFTHPAFMANAIAAALEAAGRPLSEAQAQAIGEAAEEFTEREARRLASYGEEAWALEKALDESALRDEFFSRAFGQLTAEQRDLLQPAATRGRLQADLFSSGLVWITRSRVLPFRNREGLAADVERQLFGHLALPEDRRPAAHDVIVEWVNSFPAAEWEAPVDAMSLQGMAPVSVVVTAATRELALLRRLADVARLDDATVKRLRGVDHVLVPVRQSAE
jgi:hypothetical protein